MNTIRNEIGEVTSDTTRIQKIVRIYHKQLYDNKLDNLDEKENILETYNLVFKTKSGKIKISK